MRTWSQVLDWARGLELLCIVALGFRGLGSKGLGFRGLEFRVLRVKGFKG